MLQGVPDASPRCDLSVYSYFKERSKIFICIYITVKKGKTKDKPRACYVLKMAVCFLVEVKLEYLCPFHEGM